MDQTKSSPRDIFLHLLGIITLYISAVSFGTLIFQFINLTFPDALVSGPFTMESIYTAMRFSIASLIIIFPVYVLATWYLNKSYADVPERKNLKIRKWLIYFTLFAASLIIIGDLVALIYNLLEGELTSRFILKILTVLFIAGSIFFYYFWNLRKDKIEA